MSSFPTGPFSTSLTDHATAKSELDDLLATCKQLPGAQAETELTISGGAIVPTRFLHTVDTESDAATDELTTITNTNLDDGFRIQIRLETSARIVTVEHGTDNVYLAGGVNVAFPANTEARLELERRGADWYEVGRENWEDVVVAATTTRVIADTEHGATFSNEGGGAEVDFTLPAARAGLRFTFVIENANGIEINAVGTDTIRTDSGVSAAAGLTESATVGATITLLAINATNWIALSQRGTWTVT